MSWGTDAPPEYSLEVEHLRLSLLAPTLVMCACAIASRRTSLVLREHARFVVDI